MGDQDIVCSTCGTEVPAAKEACPNCGNNLDGDQHEHADDQE